MKKTALLVTLLIFCSAAVDAQIINPRRTAKRKVEQRTNQKVDQTIDKALDKLFDGFGKKNKDKDDSTDNAGSRNSGNSDMTDEEANAKAQAGLGKMMGMFGGKSDPPQSSYSFNSSYVMQMKSTGNKKDDNYTMSMKYMFNGDGKVMGAKMVGSDNPDMNKNMGMMEAMVFDWEKNQMYSFMNMNGQKQYMSVKVKDGAVGDYIEEENDKTTFVKTAKTKKIAGYMCDGYLSTNGKDEYLVWMSREPVMSIAQYYDAVNRTSSSMGKKGKNMMAYQVNPEMLKLVKEGRAMLGMEMDDKDTRMEMEVIKISPNDNFTFSTDGYSSMMDFGAMMEKTDKN